MESVQLAEIATEFPSLRETSRMLRRGVLVVAGRQMDRPVFNCALEFGMPAVCFAFQPDRAALAHKVPGTVRILIS